MLTAGLGIRRPNLLLIGPTNNGKSMIIERFRRQHLPRTGPDREHIPVVCVQMPAEPTELRFYTALLSAIGAPFRPRQRVVDVERLALALLGEVGVRMLVIDEFHNVLAGRGETRRAFLNLLQADCSVPVGGYAVNNEDGSLTLNVVHYSDATHYTRLSETGSDPESVAATLHARLTGACCNHAE